MYPFDTHVCRMEMQLHHFNISVVGSCWFFCSEELSTGVFQKLLVDLQARLTWQDPSVILIQPIEKLSNHKFELTKVENKTSVGKDSPYTPNYPTATVQFHFKRKIGYHVYQV